MVADRLRAVFRRLVLVFMMCLLPLQWSWAAAASVCQHESSGKAHFGHHEHQHAHTGEHADGSSHDGPAAEHPDCQVCHGIGVACLAPLEGGDNTWAVSPPQPHYARVLPEPPVESLLRPPLKTLVA